MSTTHDGLIDALGDEARRRKAAEPLDARWDALAEGTLSAEDEAELRRLAGESPEAAEALEAFRPLDAATRDRMAMAALRSVAEAQPAATWPRPHATDGAADRVAASTGVASAASRRARWRRAPVFAAVAMAATFVIFAGVERLTHDVLPHYALEGGGGEQAMRGEPESGGAHEAALGPGAHVTLVLRPDTAYRGEVGVVAVLTHEGARRVRTVAAERSADGALRVDVDADAWFDAAGAWDVAFVLGSPDDVARVSGATPETGLDRFGRVVPWRVRRTLAR